MTEACTGKAKRCRRRRLEEQLALLSQPSLPFSLLPPTLPLPLSLKPLLSLPTLLSLPKFLSLPQSSLLSLPQPSLPFSGSFRHLTEACTGKAKRCRIRRLEEQLASPSQPSLPLPLLPPTLPLPLWLTPLLSLPTLLPLLQLLSLPQSSLLSLPQPSLPLPSFPPTLPLPLSLTPLLSLPMLLSLPKFLSLPPSSSLWPSLTLSLPPSVQPIPPRRPYLGHAMNNRTGRTAQLKTLSTADHYLRPDGPPLALLLVGAT